MTLIERRSLARLRLDEIRMEYRQMLDTGGFEQKKESALYGEEVSLMKLLKIYISNPCPINKSIGCVECTGMYRKNHNYKTTAGRQPWVMCTNDDPNARLCELKKRKG